MTDEHIIRDVVGRMADEAPSALDLDELGNPTLPPENSALAPGLARKWAVVGAGVAVLVVAVGAVLLVRPPGDGTAPVGAPVEATVQELRSALGSGFDALEEADGIEGVQEAYIGGHLSAQVWFSTRPDGDTAVVQQADIDVRDTAWWNMAIAPPAEGERIVTTAWIVTDEMVYQAGPSGDEEPWRVADDAPAGPLAFGLMYFDPESGDQFREQLAPSDAEATRQVTANGGTIWTATYVEGGQSRFYIHPDGYLASWEWQDLTPMERHSGPVDSGSITYTPLSDPPPIGPPQVGSALDLADLDVPESFPIGG